MMPRWAYFLAAIMFSVNLLFIGFGLTNIDSSPLSNDSLSTLDQNISSFNGTENQTVNVEDSSTNIVSSGSDDTVKFGLSEIVSMAGTFFNLIVNLLFGYTVIFWMLNLPPILVYLFSTIIGLSIIMVLLDVLIQVISAIRSLRVF